jgi:hypothetical protein
MIQNWQAIWSIHSFIQSKHYYSIPLYHHHYLINHVTIIIIYHHVQVQLGLLLRLRRRPNLNREIPSPRVHDRSQPPHMYLSRDAGSICHHIVWQPVTCGAQNRRQNVFYNYWIWAWIKKNDFYASGEPLCPHCKRPFVSGRIPPFKSILESIRLHCPITITVAISSL